MLAQAALPLQPLQLRRSLRQVGPRRLGGGFVGGGGALRVRRLFAGGVRSQLALAQPPGELRHLARVERAEAPSRLTLGPSGPGEARRRAASAAPRSAKRRAALRSYAA